MLADESETDERETGKRGYFFSGLGRFSWQPGSVPLAPPGSNDLGSEEDVGSKELDLVSVFSNPVFIKDIQDIALMRFIQFTLKFIRFYTLN